MMRERLSVAAVAVAIVTLAGCRSDGTYLPALQADPMASWEPERAELVHETTREYDEGGASSKQQLAWVLRSFEFSSAAEVKQAQQEALSFARSSGGWSADSLSRDGVLQRPGPSGSTLTLSVLPSSAYPSQLVVHVTAR